MIDELKAAAQRAPLQIDLAGEAAGDRIRILIQIPDLPRQVETRWNELVLQRTETREEEHSGDPRKSEASGH